MNISPPLLLAVQWPPCWAALLGEHTLFSTLLCFIHIFPHLKIHSASVKDPNQNCPGNHLLLSSIPINGSSPVKLAGLIPPLSPPTPVLQRNPADKHASSPVAIILRPWNVVGGNRTGIGLWRLLFCFICLFAELSVLSVC